MSSPTSCIITAAGWTSFTSSPRTPRLMTATEGATAFACSLVAPLLCLQQKDPQLLFLYNFHPEEFWWVRVHIQDCDPWSRQCVTQPEPSWGEVTQSTPVYFITDRCGMTNVALDRWGILYGFVCLYVSLVPRRATPWYITLTLVGHTDILQLMTSETWPTSSWQRRRMTSDDTNIEEVYTTTSDVSFVAIQEVYWNVTFTDWPQWEMESLCSQMTCFTLSAQIQQYHDMETVDSMDGSLIFSKYLLYYYLFYHQYSHLLILLVSFCTLVLYFVQFGHHWLFSKFYIDKSYFHVHVMSVFYLLWFYFDKYFVIFVTISRYINTMKCILFAYILQHVYLSI